MFPSNTVVRAFTCCVGIFVYSNLLGVIYDSQATNRSAAGGWGLSQRVLASYSSPGSTYMTPSRTATHFFHSYPD
jgi:hypothetical protein